ncbi:MAG: hypothetical protein ABSH14_01915 [Verrucomicrobiia bacterium]|jgi:hypothetical protein
MHCDLAGGFVLEFRLRHLYASWRTREGCVAVSRCHFTGGRRADSVDEVALVVDPMRFA